jgi:hypothetical protein
MADGLETTTDPTDREQIHVAAWWPGDREYGGATRCANESEALQVAAQVARSIKGERQNPEVHIIRTTRTVAVYRP